MPIVENRGFFMHINMKKNKKLYCLLSVFLCLFCICYFSLYLKGKTPTQVILLWNQTLSREEASTYLSNHYPSLSLLDHDSDYSLCETSSALSQKILSELNEDTSILLAEKNYLMELFEFQYPNDPYLDSSWAFENTGSYTHYYSSFPIEQLSTEGIDMNIWEAWEHYPIPKEETKQVTIAIIDTGVDYQHPDLKDQMWVNPNEIPNNGIDDDGNGYIDDIHGWDFFHNDASICDSIPTKNGYGYTANPDDNDNHGTHIAGIIGATANNGIGIAGVASNVNVKIMSLKIHGGTTSGGSIANALKAIRYAEAMGADICNLSWGTPNYSQALELIIRESSMLFVTAAGNTGKNNDKTPVFPANLQLPNLISVAFIDCNGTLDPDSNYGVSTIDIAAPGKDIYSTIVGNYGSSSGSSMAAPYVTGLAAMIYAYQDYRYPLQVKEQIINTLTPLNSLNGYIIHPGIPNASEAIRSLTLSQADTESPSLTLNTSYDKSSIIITVDAYDVGGSGVRKIRYAYDSKSEQAFINNEDTHAIFDNTVQLAKSGYYTFYIEDFAGNFNLYNYYVKDDITAPTIATSYETVPDYSSLTVKIIATDGESGIKTLKYLTEETSSSIASLRGTSLDVTKKEHHITITPDITSLTIYVADYRGNNETYVIHPKIVPATALHMNLNTRSLHLLDTFQLRPLVFPWNSTDGVTYRSLDPSVVTVNEKGLVTAVGTGTTQVEITTYSGVSAYCSFIVPELETIPEPINPTPILPQN